MKGESCVKQLTEPHLTQARRAMCQGCEALWIPAWTKSRRLMLWLSGRVMDLSSARGEPSPGAPDPAGSTLKEKLKGLNLALQRR